MKRILLAVLLFLVIWQSAIAQGPVWLPIIHKGSGCNMTDWAILEISDGTTTVNMIASNTGFHLIDWNPQIIQPKDGGVFQDSPIAQGRRLVYAIDATAIENFELAVNDYDQDGLIKQAQDLMRLLLKARAYQSTEFQSDPVWIRARAACETEDRYALIINWSIPELDNPYAQPFFTANQIAAMEDINLQIERGHWRKLQPGTGECAEVSNQKDWSYLLTAATVSSTPTAFVTGFARHAGSGALYATSHENRIMKSTDDGVTWANNLTGAPLNAADDLRGVYTLANNNILAFGDNGGGISVVRTTNDGTSWSNVSAASMDIVNDIIQVSSTGTVIAVGQPTAGTTGSIWRSVDNGGTWTQVLATSFPGGFFTTAVVASNGDILALGYLGYIYVSSDDGVTWTRLTQVGDGRLLYLLKVILASDGNLYTISSRTATTVGQVWKSEDNGITWTPVYMSNPVVFLNFIESSVNGTFLAVARINGSGVLVTSTDYGESWQQLYTILATIVTVSGVRYGIYQIPLTNILAGAGTLAAGTIARTGMTTEATVGQEDTCNNAVYVSNRNSLTQLTHVKRDDGGVFTDIYQTALPQTLYPAVPALNDALYFGVQSSVVNSGPFSNVVFDIGTPMQGIYTLTWEYWNGAWTDFLAALVLVDNTTSFGRMNVNSVHWPVPSDWTTTSVNGITGWWVRARISAITGTVTPPTQQNRQIYTSVSPGSLSETVVGDIPAIIEIKAQNQSDFGGPSFSIGNFYGNRLIVGLKSFNDDSLFNSYINLGNLQLLSDIVLSTGTNTTFVSDVQSPGGARAVYNPAGVEAMATRLTISFGSSIARDYYGTFHAFLRARRTAGSSTDLTIRLQLTTGSGGITFTTQSKQLQTTTAFEVLDFGEITLPVSSSFVGTDLGDVTSIAIQASAASGTPDLYLYDLILIPVDEWAVDAVDFANTTQSDIGRSNGISKLLDIDSIGNPKVDIETLVRTADGNEFITSEYNPITNGAAILQANANQKLWFFSMRTSATGASYSWIAAPEVTYSLQLYKNEGYLGLVGAGQ